jgi:hypothetical protein
MKDRRLIVTGEQPNRPGRDHESHFCKKNYYLLAIH